MKIFKKKKSFSQNNFLQSRSFSLCTDSGACSFYLEMVLQKMKKENGYYLEKKSRFLLTCFLVNDYINKLLFEKLNRYR